MLKTDVVRAQPAVQTFDFREILKEYGFQTGTKAEIESARGLIAAMVSDADLEMTRQLKDCEELGQNPYKRRVQVNGGEVEFAMEIPLFASGELSSRVEKSFADTAERKGRPRPDGGVIAAKVKEGIAALAREAGYDVCAVDLHGDGSPQRVVLRDPTYAAEAAQRHVGAKGPVISDVTHLLGEQHIKKLDYSAEAMGIHGAVSTEQLQGLRAAAKDVVDDAVRAIGVRLQALSENGVSPFSDQPFRFSGKTIDFLDKRLVSWGFGRSIKKPAIIEVFSHASIRQALQDRVTNHGQFVNEYTFAEHVRRELVARLRALPNLPLAAVATQRGDYSTQTLVVLVAPEVWARGRQTALPSPAAAHQLAPPAPEPEAIGPVKLPSEA